jgi:hypothetical protein
MTSDEEKAILIAAVDEAMSKGTCPSETRLHHLVQAARDGYVGAAETLTPCTRCGKMLRPDDVGPDGHCAVCLRLIFQEKGLSVAGL